MKGPTADFHFKSRADVEFNLILEGCSFGSYVFTLIAVKNLDFGSFLRVCDEFGTENSYLEFERPVFISQLGVGPLV